MSRDDDMTPTGVVMGIIARVGHVSVLLVLWTCIVCVALLKADAQTVWSSWKCELNLKSFLFVVWLVLAVVWIVIAFLETRKGALEKTVQEQGKRLQEQTKLIAEIRTELDRVVRTRVSVSRAEPATPPKDPTSPPDGVSAA
jgi:hypothetical protein